MQQVRKLGHLPRESQSHPQEQLLARQLREAKAKDLLVAFEEELEDFAGKLVATQKEAAATRTATEHAQHAQSLMQQVRKLGHLPRESESHPEEQSLAWQLRRAKANGFLAAYEEELEDCSHAHCYRACATRTEPHGTGAQAGSPAP